MTPSAGWAHRVREHATGPVSAPPPPDEHIDRLLYGLTRPIVGVRLLFQDAELLKAALYPAALLALTCAVCAVFLPGHFVVRFYRMFAWLAPWPSLFLAPYYARLAAQARQRQGYGVAEPCIEPMGRALSRIVSRSILVALAVAPLALLDGVPLFGHIVWRAALGLWALHWIVVDAFDSARVLQPGQTLADVDALVEQLPSPWFVRLMKRAATHLPVGSGLMNALARACDRLARPWRDELALVEQHPSLMVGFAIATALVLATPVLNLLFRPIILVAAVQVLGRLGESGAAEDLVPQPAA